ncbi:MAG TPA: PEP-CTERM sorting domain-containing protein [Pyrinomonadaceae bacterium]|nr:PEP-CTERM sorting domain-containing protein [Pyrinomonadaceae bacterium]
MQRRRAVPVALGVVFLVVFAASTALADAVHSNKFMNLNGMEHRSLHLLDVSRAEEEGYLFAGIHPNNGRHLGFGAAAIHRGPQLGIVRPVSPSVTQNPEPATMVLLGTGIAAVGAAIRRRRKA